MGFLTKALAVLAAVVSLHSADLYREEVNLGMVISGGVSLGAYESGYNWALIKILSRMRAKSSAPVEPILRDVSGASAGSINALLSAAYWCQDPKNDLRNGVEDNLFFKTWVDLGVEDLLVREDERENKSALFSRRVLRKKAEDIMKHLSAPLFKNGCEVSLGIAVTKANPIIEDFQGIEIRHQAFSIPLRMEVENRRIKFKNAEIDSNLTIDLEYMHIPDIEKDSARLIPGLLFASSAFPGAFTQVKMRYIYRGKEGEGYFIDGGVYNNTPLDLAIAMDERVSLFIFLDPSSMRKKQKSSKKREEKAPIGFLSTNLYPLANAADIYQKIFLYRTINRYFRGNSERRLLLSDRYLPLTAGFLEHFGAFIDRNFRLYDYHVGVYDAIYDLARAMRKKRGYKGVKQKEMMDRLARYLGIDDSTDASTAYRVFRAIEFGEKRVPRDNRYASIYYAFKKGVGEEKRYSAENFLYFLKHLDLRYLPHKTDSLFSAMLDDPEHWYKRPMRYIVDRILTLENYHAQVDPSFKPVADILNAMAWGTASLIREKEGWEIQEIHAPKEAMGSINGKLLKLLPKGISFDTVNGGMSLSYEADYYRDFGFVDGFSFRLSYDFQDREDGGDFVRLDSDIFHQYNDALTIGAGLSTFGNIQRKFWDRESAFGFNAYVDFMEIFRAGYTYRGGEGIKKQFLYLGIENIPGLLYRLGR